jgi:hypothetical protein
VLGARAHGELVHVRLADHHGASLTQLLVDVAIVGRHEIAEDLRAGGGAHALRDDEVLDGDGDTGEWRCHARLEAGVGVACLFEGEVRGDGDVGADVRLDGLDAVEDGLRQFDAGELLRPELLVGFVRGQPPEVAHSRTARTRM